MTIFLISQSDQAPSWRRKAWEAITLIWRLLCLLAQRIRGQDFYSRRPSVRRDEIDHPAIVEPGRVAGDVTSRIARFAGEGAIRIDQRKLVNPRMRSDKLQASEEGEGNEQHHALGEG